MSGVVFRKVMLQEIHHNVTHKFVWITQHVHHFGMQLIACDAIQSPPENLLQVIRANPYSVNALNIYIANLSPY